MSYCRVDHQRLPGEALFTYDIEGRERWLVFLDTALTRLFKRPEEERDTRWDKEVAGLRMSIENTQARLKELREAERDTEKH